MAVFIEQNPKYYETTRMTRVHTNYSKIISGMTEDVQQQALGERDPGSLERRVNEFEKMLIEMFGEQLDSNLYTVKYHVVDLIVGDTQDFELYLLWSEAHTSILLSISNRRMKWHRKDHRQE